MSLYVKDWNQIMISWFCAICQNLKEPMQRCKVFQYTAAKNLILNEYCINRQYSEYSRTVLINHRYKLGKTIIVPLFYHSKKKKKKKKRNSHCSVQNVYARKGKFIGYLAQLSDLWYFAYSSRGMLKKRDTPKMINVFTSSLVGYSTKNTIFQ